MCAPSGSNGSKVSLGVERVPVVLQRGLCGAAALELAERPLVYDVRVAGVVEEGGRDPGLEDEPSADVDAADFLGAIGEAWGDGAVLCGCADRGDEGEGEGEEDINNRVETGYGVGHVCRGPSVASASSQEGYCKGERQEKAGRRMRVLVDALYSRKMGSGSASCRAITAHRGGFAGREDAISLCGSFGSAPDIAKRAQT